MKLPSNEGSGFEKCPAGNHLAVCYEVVDLGTQETKFGPKRQIWIGWETPAETMEDGRPFVIGNSYTLSSNEKSNLRRDLESWRGKAFTDEEFGPSGSFEVQSIIGQACFLNVVHNDSGDKTYANVQSVAPLPKGSEAPKPVNTPTFVSLEADEFDVSAFERLNEWLQKKVSGSTEYAAITGKAPVAAGMPDFPSGDSGSDEQGSPF